MLPDGSLTDPEGEACVTVAAGYSLRVQPPTEWPRRIVRWAKPVRIRLTLLATLLAAAVLTGATAVVLMALQESYERAADVAVTARARQIAAVAETSGLDGLTDALLTPGRYVDLIQVVDPAGRIVFSDRTSGDGALGPTLSAGRQERAQGLSTMPGGPTYRVALVAVDTPGDGPVTVQVGAEEAPLGTRVRHTALLAAGVVPALIVACAAMTYFLVTRTLRPVDDIRREVEDISAGDLDRRVPVPDTEDEIATLATTMNRMLDRIAAARARQVRFVGDASHELNSPLTTLVGLLDLAREKQQAVDPDTVGSIMLPEALRLQHMVADLLILARADENGIPLRNTDVDLDDVVGTEIARLDALGGHTVTATIVAARVHGDREKLERALRNIADNAARHAHSRLDFTITVDDVARCVTVAVADDGPGIADADKGRVLERFVRLDSSRERARGGSGLGLAIADEIVRAHGGAIFVSDTPGGGATVGFTVPLRTPGGQPPPSSASR